MSNQKTEILSFEAGADLVEGDIVYLNTDNEAVKVTAAEATNAIGIVYADADEGEQVSVIVRGIATARVLVEDTNGSSGYDDPIARGDQLVISGKAAGTYVAGQALSSTGGTGVSTADATTIVGKALGAVAGVSGDDTYTTIKAYVSFM